MVYGLWFMVYGLWFMFMFFVWGFIVPVTTVALGWGWADVLQAAAISEGQLSNMLVRFRSCWAPTVYEGIQSVRDSWATCWSDSATVGHLCIWGDTISEGQLSNMLVRFRRCRAPIGGDTISEGQLSNMLVRFRSCRAPIWGDKKYNFVVCPL